MNKIYFNRILVAISLTAVFLLGKGCHMAQKTRGSGSFESLENVRNITVKDLHHVIIRTDDCSIKITQSPDIFTRIKATGSGTSKLNVIQNGNVLNLESLKNNATFFSRTHHIDFLIELGNGFVPEIDIDTGYGKVEIKTPVKNLCINAGNIELYAEDLEGGANFNCGNGTFTLVHKTFAPVSYQIDAGSAEITALLAREYKSVSNNIEGGSVTIKESALPIRPAGADFNLSGDVGSAKIFIRELN